MVLIVLELGGDYGDTKSQFNGMIDELAIYNRVLGATELISHYRVGQTPMTGEAFRINGNLTTGNWSIQMTPINSVKAGTSINTSIVINSLTQPTDSCTWSGSGTWNINCYDNCSISSNVNLLRNNITISGYGRFTVTSSGKIINYGNRQINGQSSTNTCDYYDYGELS